MIVYMMILLARSLRLGWYWALRGAEIDFESTILSGSAATTLFQKFDISSLKTILASEFRHRFVLYSIGALRTVGRRS